MAQVEKQNTQLLKWKYRAGGNNPDAQVEKTSICSIRIRWSPSHAET